jgi:hypothetical protein
VLKCNLHEIDGYVTVLENTIWRNIYDLFAFRIVDIFITSISPDNLLPN